MHIDRTRLDRSIPVSEGSLALPIAGSTLALLLFAGWLHPSPLVLPVLSIILVVSGFLLAAIILVRHREPIVGTRMMLPALIVFCGFAAAMMGDPDVAVQQLRQMR